MRGEVLSGYLVIGLKGTVGDLVDSVELRMRTDNQESDDRIRQKEVERFQ